MRLVIFLAGLLLMIVSHPRLLSPILTRLANERIVTQRKLKRDEAEVIRFAGPNLSIFFIGFLFVIAAFLLKK